MAVALGLRELVAIGVGGMVGGGIFAVLGLAAEVSGAATPVAFALAGLVALLTAYSYAKLSTAYPSRGGTVEYVGLAFRNGVMAGWINVLLLLSYIIMLSLYARAFGSYGAALIGGGKTWMHILATGVLLAFATLNVMGSDVVGRAEDVIVYIKVAILVLFVLAGLRFVDASRLSPTLWPDPLSVVAGGMLIFLAYEGFELISNAAEDAESKKALYRSFFFSVGLVVALYVSVAAVAVGVLSPGEVGKYRDYVLAVAAEPALGKIGFVLIAVAALLSTASAINATLYGSARVAYTLAVMRELPRFLEKKVWRVPEGLALVAGLAILVANTVDLSGISTMGSAGFLIVFAAVNLSAFVLRKRIGANPLVTAAATVATLAALTALLAREASRPENVVFFAVLVGMSLLVELVYRAVSSRRMRLRFWSEHSANAPNRG